MKTIAARLESAIWLWYHVLRHAFGGCGGGVAMLMREQELLSVTPWEVRLMLDASEGLTYREIALRRGRKVRTVERTFERMREKLRPWGGGSKAGLVHWVDVHYGEWLDAQGLPLSREDAARSRAG